MRPRRAAKPSTAARAVSSDVWPYTSPVMAMEEWPSRSATALMCPPDSSRETAAEWRRVCTPTPSTFAALDANDVPVHAVAQLVRELLDVAARIQAIDAKAGRRGCSGGRRC